MKSTQQEIEIQAITRNLEELEIAENRKSIEEILYLVTDDFMIVFHDRVISGKADLAAMLQESIKNFISSKHVPSRIEVASSCDLAWLFGYELNQRAKGSEIVETKQFYIITFRKEGGTWKQSAVCVA